MQKIADHAETAISTFPFRRRMPEILAGQAATFFFLTMLRQHSQYDRVILR